MVIAFIEVLFEGVIPTVYYKLNNNKNNYVQHIPLTVVDGPYPIILTGMIVT